MSKQKFKRGNLVRINEELDSSMSHFPCGRDAIIIGSYADKCGGGNTGSYTLMFPDTGGQVSWYREDQLTLIDEGGEHLIEEAKMVSDRIYKEKTDIAFLASGIDSGELSSDSILFLFDMLGFDSESNRNGEYFALFFEWTKLQPAFLHIKNSKSLEEARSMFTEDVLLKYNIEKVYYAFKGVKLTEN